MSLKKINSKLEFPKELDLKKYLINEEIKDTEYKLKGVILHTGFA
jgi:hypothetical protein